MTQTIHDFGEALIRTQDLDPVYVAIWGARLPRDQVERLLLAYLCFYHLGVAAWMSEHYGTGFWYAMDVAARNEDVSPLGERWPRAAERRHFRGAKCVGAVRWLQEHYDAPEAPVRSLAAAPDRGNQLTDAEVITRVKRWPMFGPWVAFKAADMLERCLGVDVAFDPYISLMYGEPRAGLDLLVSLDPGGNPREWWYRHLLQHFSRFVAPPAHDRACGPQEVETVLCKWKAHMGGHYTVGKDLREVSHALGGWGETAQKLLAAMPASTVMEVV